tara:strand:- start:3823 stop:4968 length:1146 start_codon:yes stop_codon:yes gene_type:complete
MSQSCPRPDPAIVPPALAWQRAAHYFRQAAPAAQTPGGRLAAIAHPVLMAASFGTAEQGTGARPVRRSSITEDGTPVIYSFKDTREPGGPAFRCVVEPGGYAVRTDEQIQRAVHCLEELCGALGWHRAAQESGLALAKLLPRPLTLARSWWGGIWLGIDAAPEAFRLKAYVNLRPHEPGQRWQMAQALAAQLDADLVANDTIAGAGNIPLMGVGLAIEADRICAVRLYFGLDQATPQSVGRLAGEFDPDARLAIELFAREFTASFGAFSHQSVAICLDYPVSAQGRLAARAARFKLELCAEMLAPETRCQVLSWYRLVLPRLGLADSLSVSKADQARSIFGGLLAKYVSLGVTRSGECSTTLYAHPMGLRLEDGLIEEIAS